MHCVKGPSDRSLKARAMEGNPFPSFTRGFFLLKGNWSIFFPGIVVGIASGALQTIFAPRASFDVAGDFLNLFVRVIIGVIATILVVTYTTGMAHALWTSGRTTLSDGIQAVRRAPVDLLFAVGGLIAIGLAAAFLAPFTVGISIAVYAYFCIYAIPCVIIGRRSGIEAIVESSEVAARRPFETGGLVAAMVIVAAIAIGIGYVLPARSFLGPVLSQTLLETLVAYVTVVVAGEYMILWGMVSAE